MKIVIISRPLCLNPVSRQTIGGTDPARWGTQISDPAKLEAACRVTGVDAVYVATDDARIRDAAQSFGADVIMTSETCRNGTERCAEALENAALDADLIVNLQGDAPLTPHWFVEDLIAAMKQDADAQMATPVLRLDRLTYGHFTTDRREGRVGGTTAIFDKNNHALYFSKEVVPFMDIDKWPLDAELPVFHHVGVYAYRSSAERLYVWPEGTLEGLRGWNSCGFGKRRNRQMCRG